MSLFKLSTYDYRLPDELIAQKPLAQRDHSRLMIIERETGRITIDSFSAIRSFLSKDDALILNDTKVIPARLIGKRTSGAKVELFLVRPDTDGLWTVMAKPGRKLAAGATVAFDDLLHATVVDVAADGLRLVRFTPTADLTLDEAFARVGQMPLPQYIRRERGLSKEDVERYQTVYAHNPGAVAAPTAGLHFTTELLDDLQARGVQQIPLTLHVGLGTFKPVHSEDIRQHEMHEERCLLREDTAFRINEHKCRHPTRRRLCVGTTCCRALETAADDHGFIESGEYDTAIFIYPGYRFKHVEALLTNFHQPRSTLLMLVSAFAGYDLIMEAYAKAIEARLRFFSYGDAMLIV